MKQKNLILKSLILFLIIFSIYFNLSFGRIKFNGAGGGYDEGAGILEIGDQSIESYIIAGAGYYLDANSHIQTLLKMMELQDTPGIDYNTMQLVVENALTNMEKAKATYEKLIQKAENTPYNQAVLERLKDFDYDAFMQENSLNTVLFEAVRQKLQPGDITGIFKSTYSDFNDMIDMLDEINLAVSQNKLPGLSIFWQLNETLARSSTIGSYVVRVFAEIF
jgi:hypothetical protein